MNRKQKIGDCLNCIVLIGLLFFAVLMLFDIIKPTKKAGGLMFSGALLASSISALLTEEIGIRSGTITKLENPTGYWFVLIFNLVVAIWVFIATRNS